MCKMQDLDFICYHSELNVMSHLKFTLVCVIAECGSSILHVLYYSAGLVHQAIVRIDRDLYCDLIWKICIKCIKSTT